MYSVYNEALKLCLKQPVIHRSNKVLKTDYFPFTEKIPL